MVCGFEVGDRVVVTVDSPEANHTIHAGDTGTVVVLWPNSPDRAPGVGVKMDKKVAMSHSCDGHCPAGFGWNFWNPEKQLEPLFEEEIQCSDQSLGVLL